MAPALEMTLTSGSGRCGAGTRGKAACGYAGLKGSREAVAFVSRPNRILMSHDPLTGEFATLKSRYCPGFDAPAPAAVSGKS